MRRAALLLVLAPLAAAAAPEDPGSLEVTVTSAMVPVGGGVQLSTDLYVPATGGPYPTLVLRHGFARSKANFFGWGQHLASRGFVTLAPTSRAPLAPNPDVDSDDMLAVLAWAVAEGTSAGSPLDGKVDPTRLAVAGHSAGGLACALAASKDPSLRASVLFDPVDAQGGAAAAAATVVPTVALFAEPGTCNMSGNFVPLFGTIPAPRFGLKVLGAQHCAPEDPSDSLCWLGCGGEPTAAQLATFRRYATAFLEAYVKCDPAALPYVNGAAATADPAIEILPESAGLTDPPAGCAGAPDGGAPGDGGITDAVAAGDSAAAADAAAAGDGPAPGDDAGAGPGADAGAGADSDDGGCGCRASGGSTALAGLALLLLLAKGRRARGARPSWRRR